MKKLLLLVLITLLTACNTVSQNNKDDLLIDSTNYNVEYPNEDVYLEEIIPEDIQDIYLAFDKMTLRFKDKDKYLEKIGKIQLYYEHQVLYYGAGGSSATLVVIDKDNDTHTYNETLSDTLKVESMEDGIKKSKTYGYFAVDDNEDKNSKVYLTKMFEEALYPFYINIDMTGRVNDCLQVLYAETDDYVIESEYSKVYFTYSFDRLVEQYGFDPNTMELEIYEDDKLCESLPSEKGEHLVVLKKDNTLYQLSYNVE